MPLTVAVAGSTHRTQLIAESLHLHPSLDIPWVLTPAPRAQGRQQEVVANPFHRWASQTQISTVLIQKSLTSELKTHCDSLEKPDILLVVDFGYYVPPWLLELPKIASLNFHPSALPAWRGSSPGQLVLLAGDTQSAVSVMVMNEHLDQGPLIYQTPFAVNQAWNQTDYYAFSYQLIAPQLPQILLNFAKNPAQQRPQPFTSPTPIARRLTKDDAFVAWPVVQAALQNVEVADSPLPFNIPPTIAHQPVLAELLAASPATSHPVILEHAHRAFAPWPMLWTTIPTAKGDKRLQIQKCGVRHHALVLETVKIEGLAAKPWPEVKNQLIS